MARIQVSKLRRVGSVTLADDTIRIGRSSDNDVVLPSSSVSRHHCTIDLIDGAPHLKDLGSSHGTRINGQSVSSARLFDGDHIGVGSFELVFEAPEFARQDADDSMSIAAPPATDALLTERQALQAERISIDAARQAVDAERVAVASEQDALAAERRVIDEARRAIDDVRNQLDSTREDLDERVADMDARDKDHDVLRQRMEDAESMSTQLQNELDTIRDRHAALEKDIAARDDTIAALRADLDKTGEHGGQVADLEST
ncbi:MAG: FHA domain-containing protein, partial [Planctomycetota bacterium]